MAGSKEIKRRIKSVKSTKKITKAMELVAASKMKRAVASTLSSRLYAEYSWDILTSLSKNLEEISHPLFEKREGGNTLLIFITSNRGLCGAYNSQVTKKALQIVKQQNNKNNLDLITVGRKGDVAMRRIGRNIIATFTELPANISLSDVAPISKLVLAEYTAGKYDKVLVAYTDFISAMTQKPNIKQVLPISKTDLKELIAELGEAHSTPSEVAQGKESRIDYLIEGNRDKLLGSLAEKLTRMQIYQMLLESNASEQSSRMVAMKNASEAAGEMIDDLTLVFNKARQAGITQEISEISAGMASVS
ncbi:MAG: ATP synthase F1 subunit gamma [bacterium]|nr:ATP synthase F1 subunit gamma [bacterium]